jgi:hypothetical protein
MSSAVCGPLGAAGPFAATGDGSPAETTGKSDSSSDPRAAGKSDGIGERWGGNGGAAGFGAAAGIFCVGAAGGATPTIVRCLVIAGGRGGALP